MKKRGDLVIAGFYSMLVNVSINSVNNAYETLMRALINVTQSKFINLMNMYFACNGAKKILRKFLIIQ